MTRTDLKVGFACNNRCVFCAQGDRRAREAAAPLDVLVGRLRAAGRPPGGLVLTGGEPTVRRDLAALVAAARGLGYRPIQLQTNARMLCYPGLVERLVRAGLTEVSPALHGPCAEVHDALTRAPGSFDQTLAGIDRCLDAGLPVITNTVVVTGNLEHLAATIVRLVEGGVRQAQLAMVHPVGAAAGAPDVVPRLERAAPFVQAAVRAGRARGARVVVEAMPPCLLGDVADAAVEARIPETVVVDLDGARRDFSAWRRVEGKRKGPRCASCRLASACEGPWREYGELHGWAALEPIDYGSTPPSSSNPSA